MRPVSIGAAGLAATASRAAPVKRSRSGPSIPMTMPGLVQNWPAPSVSDPTNAAPSSAAASDSRPGSRKTGLTALISAKTGIGTGRDAAAATSASPTRREPVKATAAMAGWVTSSTPTVGPSA